MAVQRYHANGLGVEHTAPLEFVGTFACDGGKTVQIVFTAHMAALLVSKIKDALPEETAFGE